MNDINFAAYVSLWPRCRRNANYAVRGQTRSQPAGGRLRYAHERKHCEPLPNPRRGYSLILRRNARNRNASETLTFVTVSSHSRYHHTMSNTSIAGAILACQRTARGQAGPGGGGTAARPGWLAPAGRRGRTHARAPAALGYGGGTEALTRRERHPSRQIGVMPRFGLL